MAIFILLVAFTALGAITAKGNVPKSSCPSLEYCPKMAEESELKTYDFAEDGTICAGCPVNKHEVLPCIDVNTAVRVVERDGQKCYINPISDCFSESDYIVESKPLKRKKRSALLGWWGGHRHYHNYHRHWYGKK